MHLTTGNFCQEIDISFLLNRNGKYQEKSEPSERHSYLAVHHHREIRIWYDTLREKVPQGSGVLIGGIS